MEMIEFFANASTFALDVYRGKDRPALPLNYQWLCDVPADMSFSNYFGAAYYMHVTDPDEYVQVVIAHRGTVLSFGNLHDDLDIALGKIPNEFVSAIAFTEYVKQKITAKFPHKNGSDNYPSILYWHVGHSLGAILTELCVARYILEDEGTVGISFESPGSKPIMDKLVLEGRLNADAIRIMKQMPTMFICNADVNCINTCNEQIAQVYQIEDGYELPITRVNPTDISFYILFFTLDQHSILKIYNYWSSPIEKGPILRNWPIGLEVGYQYYMKYSNHSSYWEAAMENVWKNDPNLEARFFNIYQDYHESMMKKYFSDTNAQLISKVGLFKPSNQKSQLLEDIEDDYVFVEKPDINVSTIPEEQPATNRCLVM